MLCLHKFVWVGLLASVCASASACVQTLEGGAVAGVSATSAALVSGASCDPQNAAGVASSVERAMLDTIAYTEGTRGHGKDGYNVTFNYRYFDSCEEHPNIKICTDKVCSTAAGRYQFLNKTYLGLNLESFWPADQERGALELIERRGVDLPEAPLTATQFANVLDRLSYEWSSLPPGRYGTPRLSASEIRAEYCRLAGCGKTPAAGSGPSLLSIDGGGVLSRYHYAAGAFSGTPVSYGWETATSVGAGADYDEDGQLDFLAVDAQYGLEIYLGDGAGDYDLRPVTLSGEPLRTLGPGADYDEDGYADFVAVDESQRLVLLRGDGQSRFSVELVTLYADDLHVLGGGADFDGDEHADFVALSDTGSSWLYAGDGTGRFSVHSVELPRLALLSRGRDWTGDGLADLAAVTREGQALLLAQTASSGFEAHALTVDWDDALFLN